MVHCRRESYDVYVGRGSPFGNPFRIGPDGTRAQVLVKYERWLLSQPDLVARAIRELAGKVLGCWCHPLACHGDILARIVNGGDGGVNLKWTDGALTCWYGHDGRMSGQIVLSHRGGGWRAYDYTAGAVEIGGPFRSIKEAKQCVEKRFAAQPV